MGRNLRTTGWWLGTLLAVGVSLGLGSMAHPAGAATSSPPRAVASPGALVPPRWGRVRPALAWAGMAPGASSPVTWTQQAELTSTAQSPGDGYGSAVAISGNTAVVGAQETPFDNFYGAVYVFTRTTSGVWSQQAELLDPGYGGGVSDAFGIAVALQGNILAVGAPGATGGLGAVYLYGRSGTTWTQQAIITPTDATQPEDFGTALALWGTTLVVGANYQDGGEGAAYIFVYNGHTWQQQADLPYPGHVLFAKFGYGVALWGSTLLVSAPLTPVAFVYTRSGTTWRVQSLLSAPNTSSAYFGHSIALWGNTALVSSCCAFPGTPGLVYIYTASGGVWTRRAVLTPPNGPRNFIFGTSLALSYQTAVIGGEGEYVYVGSGATWTPQAQLTPSDRPPTDLGSAVAIQANTAVAGATNVNGTSYVFVRSGADWAADEGASLAYPVQASNWATRWVRGNAIAMR